MCREKAGGCQGGVRTEEGPDRRGSMHDGDVLMDQNSGGLKELLGLEAPGVNCKVPGRWSMRCFKSRLWRLLLLLKGLGSGVRLWSESLLIGGRKEELRPGSCIIIWILKSPMTMKLVLENDSELGAETVNE